MPATEARAALVQQAARRTTGGAEDAAVLTARPTARDIEAEGWFRTQAGAEAANARIFARTGDPARLRVEAEMTSLLVPRDFTGRPPWLHVTIPSAGIAGRVMEVVELTDDRARRRSRLLLEG